MTLPRERRQALKNTQRFLYDLLDPKKTPKVPLAIRVVARNCLRHYPNGFDMGRPLLETFGEPEEPTVCLLECSCGRRSQLLDVADDKCDKCGEKMRVVRTYLASEY